MKLRNIILSVLISAVCLYFVLRNVDWRQVWTHLTQVNPVYFLISMVAMLAAYFLMAWRWRSLLDPLEVPGPSGANAPSPAGADNMQAGASLAPSGSPVSHVSRGVRGHASIFDLYGMMMTGYFFNSFFPARAGDIVRAYLLGRRTGLSKTTVLATVVIEKAFDGIALLLMLLLSMLLLPSATNRSALGFDPSTLAWLSGLGLVIAVAGLALFYMHNVRIARLVEKILSYLPLPDKLRKMAVRLIETFASGMHVFKTPGPLISAALISLLVWGVVAVMFWFGMESFAAPFPADMRNLVGLLFMTAVVDLGLLVPALPGNVGTYEALVVAVMAFFKVDKDLAVAFALIFHVGQLITTLIVGMIAFWAQNMSLSEMRPIEERAEEDADRALAEPIA